MGPKHTPYEILKKGIMVKRFKLFLERFEADMFGDPIDFMFKALIVVPGVGGGLYFLT